MDLSLETGARPRTRGPLLFASPLITGAVSSASAFVRLGLWASPRLILLSRACSALILRNGPGRLINMYYPGRLLYVAGALYQLITPCLMEEAYFRGLLYVAPRTRLPRGTALILSAATFSLLHSKPLIAGSVSALLVIFLFGLSMGVIYDETGSLIPCILIHAGANLVPWVLPRTFLGPAETPVTDKRPGLTPGRHDKPSNTLLTPAPDLFWRVAPVPIPRLQTTTGTYWVARLPAS